MTDEQLSSIMREFLKALEAKDVDKVLSFYAEDGDWTTSEGMFKGKEELKRYLKWQFSLSPDMKITECGNGIIVKDNKAFIEHMISGTIMGKKVEILAMCAWEFSDGKIKHNRTTNDRLSMAKQAAKGWLPKWIVNSVISQAEKGLH